MSTESFYSPSLSCTMKMCIAFLDTLSFVINCWGSNDGKKHIRSVQMSWVTFPEFESDLICPAQVGYVKKSGLSGLSEQATVTMYSSVQIYRTRHSTCIAKYKLCPKLHKQLCAILLKARMCLSMWRDGLWMHLPETFRWLQVLARLAS